MVRVPRRRHRDEEAAVTSIFHLASLGVPNSITFDEVPKIEKINL